MTTRPLKPSDIPIIRAAYEKKGFAFQFPDLCGPLIETVLVAVDEHDRPVMAIAVERIVQLYMFDCSDLPPLVKLRLIDRFHAKMATILRRKGYTEANAFLPPQIEGKFGRRLQEKFGWVKNWSSWAIRF